VPVSVVRPRRSAVIDGYFSVSLCLAISATPAPAQAASICPTAAYTPRPMIRQAVVLAVVVGGVAVLSAQAPEQSTLAFEVASVKPSPANPPSVASLGSLRLPPGRWRALRNTLLQLMGTAYPEHRFEGRVVGGPAWVRKDLFDIEARMDPTITLAEVGPLAARLLADRFALRTHIEQRPVEVYLLKTARDDGRLGPQMKRSDASCIDAKTTRQVPPRECRGTMPAGGGLNLATNQIADFLQLLAFNGIDRPVLDRTGLTGYFDFQLTYQCGPFTGPFGSRPCGPDALSFFTALQEQAGLTLEPAREVIDVLVIDSVEQPTPN
jgi:uncharacterized protein (TIGR03435 family)